MARILKYCPNCNCPIELQNVSSADGEYVCGYCINKVKIQIEDDDYAKDFEDGVSKRNAGEFDSATAVFEKLLKKYSEKQTDINWQLLLCKYGVVYAEREVNNQVKERKITCWKKVDTDIYHATEYLRIKDKSRFEDDVRTISEIQERIKRTSSSYDIFICYKETPFGSIEGRTYDSSQAEKIYTKLKHEYKVFFARETLQNKLGTDYEATIYNAIDSAKIMIVIGSRKDYLDSTWVKNEWKRFLYSCKKKTEKKIIPLFYNGVNDLPDELKEVHQGTQMDNINILLEDVYKTLPPFMNRKFIINEVDSDKVREGEVYFARNDLENAYSCFYEAACKGNTKARYYYGVKLLTDEQNPNPEEAFKWFRKAAEDGLVEAQEQLSIMYEYGIGVAENVVEKTKWKDLAKKNRMEGEQS